MRGGCYLTGHVQWEQVFLSTSFVTSWTKNPSCFRTLPLIIIPFSFCLSNPVVHYYYITPKFGSSVLKKLEGDEPKVIPVFLFSPNSPIVSFVKCLFFLEWKIKKIAISNRINLFLFLLLLLLFFFKTILCVFFPKKTKTTHSPLSTFCLSHPSLIISSPSSCYLLFDFIFCTDVFCNFLLLSRHSCIIKLGVSRRLGQPRVSAVSRWISTDAGATNQGITKHTHTAHTHTERKVPFRIWSAQRERERPTVKKKFWKIKPVCQVLCMKLLYGNV